MKPKLHEAIVDREGVEWATLTYNGFPIARSKEDCLARLETDPERTTVVSRTVSKWTEVEL